MTIPPEDGRCAQGVGDALSSQRRSGVEVWRPVPDFEGYAVSNRGRVRSFHRGGRILSLGTDETGYPTAAMNRAGRRTTKTVHRLVALAFRGPAKNALHREVAHLDGDNRNAHAFNLRWVSKVENEAHKLAHGTRSSERFSKLTEEQVAYARSQLGKKSHAQIARELGAVKADAISKLARGVTWRAHKPAS